MDTHYTHNKFNPEGVKGKTTQPPHNFYKIMTNSNSNSGSNFVSSRANRTFKVTIGIYDANTRIRLDEATRVVTMRGASIRHERWALDEVKREFFEHWAKPNFMTRFCLTASQFTAMWEAGVINPLSGFDFQVIESREFRLFSLPEDED